MSLREINASADRTARAGEFARVMMLLARANGDALAALRSEAGQRSTPRVQAILQRASTDPGSTSGALWAEPLADHQQAAGAWLESLRFVGVFDRMLSDMRVVPPRTRITAVTSGFTGQSVGELSAWPISSLTLAGSTAAGLEPRAAGAICVVSDELRGMATPVSQNLLNQEMQAGVVAAVDKTFLDALAASVSATGASAGATAINVYADVGVMLAAVSTGANSKVFIVHTPANMRKLMVKTDTAGQLAFPGLSLNGGMICGLPALVSDQLTSASCMMVVADGIMADGGTVFLDWSKSASPQMDTALDSPPAAGTTALSLFQHNLQGLRATRWFGFEVCRAASAVVSHLSGVNY